MIYLDTNVFNPNTAPLGMDFRVDTPGQVRIIVYNIAAEVVARVLDENKAQGNYRVYWDGRNKSGEVVGNAVYFVIIQEPSGHMVRRVIVLK